MTNNHKYELVKTVVINGINYNVYAVFCINLSGDYEECGYDLYRGTKVIATFVDIPTEDRIKELL